jgi:hypothetical protein
MRKNNFDAQVRKENLIQTLIGKLFIRLWEQDKDREEKGKNFIRIKGKKGEYYVYKDEVNLFLLMLIVFTFCVSFILFF